MGELVHRRNPERHRQQVRAANRARYKAMERLIAAHRAEFDAIYAEVCAAADPPIKPGYRPPAYEPVEQKIARLQLREVSAIYLANVGRNPVEEVQRELHLGTRATAKYRVKMARQLGLLPPIKHRKQQT